MSLPASPPTPPNSEACSRGSSGQTHAHSTAAGSLPKGLPCPQAGAKICHPPGSLRESAPTRMGCQRGRRCPARRPGDLTSTHEGRPAPGRGERFAATSSPAGPKHPSVRPRALLRETPTLQLPAFLPDRPLLTSPVCGLVLPRLPLQLRGPPHRVQTLTPSRSRGPRFPASARRGVRGCQPLAAQARPPHLSASAAAPPPRCPRRPTRHTRRAASPASGRRGPTTAAAATSAPRCRSPLGSGGKRVLERCVPRAATCAPRGFVFPSRGGVHHLAGASQEAAAVPPDHGDPSSPEKDGDAARHWLCSEALLSRKCFPTGPFSACNPYVRHCQLHLLTSVFAAGPPECVVSGEEGKNRGSWSRIPPSGWAPGYAVV